MSASDSFSTQLAFNDITDTTRLLLVELHPMLMGAIPGILDEFYAFLEGFPEVNRFFATPAIKAHAKAAQIAHWDHLLSAKFDETYHRSANRIGETHHRLGLEPQWYIGAYRRLLSGVIRHIEVGTTSRFAGRAFYEKKAAMIDALLKAVMLDMDIIIALYLDAGKRERMSTLQRLSDQFEESVGQIAEGVAAMSEDLKIAADGLKDTASNTQLLSTTVASASEQASASVRSVATGTEHLGSSVAEISQQVQESLQTSNDAVAQAESANGQIAELSRAASRIGDVVKIISSIAEQTNLLALNATIEAARAGEAGKGFAVVAHEVKQLATQTAKATQEISIQINDMQTSTGAAVEAILAIGKTIDSVSRNSQAIHDAVNRQNTATREITHNINTAASGSAEVAATISEVNQGAEATKTAAGSVHTSADKLTGEGQKLRAEVNNFLATLRSA